MGNTITVFDFQTAVGVIVGILAIIAVAWGGVKAIKEAMAPLTDLIKSANLTAESVHTLETEVTAIQKRMRDYDGYFHRDKRELERNREELDDLRKANTLVLRGMSQLIAQELSGNQTAELKQTQKDMTEYLLKRK